MPDSNSEVSKICGICGEEIRLVEIECEGARQRGEPMPKQEACRCCHPGDFFCNCGKPCWSFF